MSSNALIPYIDEPNPITGVTNAKFGTWLFLASEVMLFGALFSTFIIMRVGAETWPRGLETLNVPLALLNTVVLITSSVTMVMSWASLKMNEFGKFRLYLATTILLALVFMVVKSIEYSAKFHHGITPATSTFFAVYFTMTGLHGLHVLGGIVLNAYYLIPGAKMWETHREQFIGRVECAGLYWHFVDLVWIFLFPCLYLL